jgi:hypothetical protein
MELIWVDATLLPIEPMITWLDGVLRGFSVT